MRTCVLFCAVLVAVLAVTHAASVEQVEAEGSVLYAEGPAQHAEERVLHRMRREDCNSADESLECDKFCRRLGLSGGACLRNRCDCDRW